MRHESVTPERTITTDTYIPLSPKDLSTEAKSQQDEVYRILQTNFLHFAAPNGGVAWPEQLMDVRQLPSKFRTPSATPLFSPDTFTSGDSLSLPDRPINIGDSWETPNRALSGDVSGTAKYRVLGRVNLLGHECWQIEGTTIYELLSESVGNMTSFEAGPRRSMHYFDSKIGRLVLSEETTPLRISFIDGRVTEINVRTKRQLAQPTSEESVRLISRKLADGQTREFLFRGGSPANVEKDWLKVVHSGMTLEGIQNPDGKVTVSNLVWFIVCDFSGRDVSSLKLLT